MSFTDKLKQLAAKRQFRIFFFVFLALLFLLILWRSCSGPERFNSKTYHIARSANLSPLKMEGKEPNLLAFESDLIQEIAKEEKLKILLYTVSYTNLFDPLNKDEYDGALMVLDPNSYMKELYYISDPIFYGGPVLIVPESSTVTSLKELQGKGIGIESGSPLIFKLSQENQLLVSYTSMISALEDLDKGILSGVILDANLAYTYTEGFYKNKLKIATAPLTELGIRLVAKDTSDGKYLVEQFNEGLKKIKENGKFLSLIRKWELKIDATNIH